MIPIPPPLYNDSASDSNYCERLNQNYETPLHQQQHDYYDEHDDSYPARPIKKSRYDSNNNFFDNDEGNNVGMNIDSRRNGSTMNVGMNAHDPRWNNTNDMSEELNRRDGNFYSQSQLNTPAPRRSLPSTSPLIRPAHHHLGTPDEDTNLVYEASNNDSTDKSGRRQTKLAFKKKRN